MLTNSSTRYCVSCGQAARETWKHCPACGMELPDAPSIQMAGAIIKNGDLARDKKWSEAVQLLRDGDPDKAWLSLSTLLQSFPQDAEALALAGSICLRRYQIEDAECYLEQAIATAPDSVFVRLKMAEYWVALGIPARALEELTKAESLAADDLYLRKEILSYSRTVREKTKGNILREAPALSGGFSLGFQKKKVAA